MTDMYTNPNSDEKMKHLENEPIFSLRFVWKLIITQIIKRW